MARLRDRTETVATAESLTGGLVGVMITAVPGASAVYRGGLITYATELKHELARVSAQTLATHGPVAAATAEQMARGAAEVCDAAWGLATTGVAGPDPQDGHPVGQVFIAVAGPNRGVPPSGGRGSWVRELSLSGDRAALRQQAAEAALALLLTAIKYPRH